MNRKALPSLLLALPVLATLAACGSSQGHLESVAAPPMKSPAPVEFMEVRNSWLLDFSQDDPAVAAVYYAPDAHVVFFNSEYDGSAEIRGWLDQQIPNVRTLNVDSPDFDVDDDTITENGDYTGAVDTGTGEQEISGHYTAVWRETADGWKIVDLTIR